MYFKGISPVQTPTCKSTIESNEIIQDRTATIGVGGKIRPSCFLLHPNDICDIQEDNIFIFSRVTCVLVLDMPCKSSKSWVLDDTMLEPLLEPLLVILAGYWS